MKGSFKLLIMQAESSTFMSAFFYSLNYLSDSLEVGFFSLM